MAPPRAIPVSKFLSYVLGHRPDKLGLELDDAGWVEVDVLLRAMADHGQPSKMLLVMLRQ